MADEPIAVDDHLPARQHQLRAAGHDHALEHVVVDSRVVGIGRDHQFPLRIEHHDVRVAARRDRPLPGITEINGFLGHDGAIFGYGSTMLYLPSRHATIVVLGNNNDNGAPKPLITAVAIAAYLFPGHFPHGL